MAGNRSGSQRTRKAPSTRGDHTGRMKETLQREHEEAVEARRGEIGLISGAKAAVKQDGIIDMMGETPVLDMESAPDWQQQLAAQLADKGPTQDGPIDDALHGQPVDTTAREPMVQQPQAPVPPQGTRIGSQDSVEVFELPPEKPLAAVTAGQTLDKDQLNFPTEIRSLYDLEDVTIGYGNTYTFRADYKYRVPYWIAMHLQEKGLCDVLSVSAA